MASHAGQKPLILSAAEADLKRADARAIANARLAENQGKPPTRSSSGTLPYIVAVLLLVGVGYLLFSSNWNAMPTLPTIAETVPSPDIDATVAPVPATPPAPQITPPPADAPATNP